MLSTESIMTITIIDQTRFPFWSDKINLNYWAGKCGFQKVSGGKVYETKN